MAQPFRARRAVAVPFTDDVREVLAAALGPRHADVVAPELARGLVAIRAHYARQAGGAGGARRTLRTPGDRAAIAHLMQTLAAAHAALTHLSPALSTQLDATILATATASLVGVGGHVKQTFTGWGAAPHRESPLSREAHMVAQFTAQLLDQVDPGLLTISAQGPCARVLEVLFAEMREPEPPDYLNLLRRVVRRARAVNAALRRGEWVGPLIQPQITSSL